MSDTQPKPGIRAQMLSDRQVDSLENYQKKIRALRDNYHSFEVALAEAQKQLKITNEQVVESQKSIVKLEEVSTKRLEDKKFELEKSIGVLEEDKKNLTASVDRMHGELHEGLQKLQDEQKKVSDLERDLKVRLENLEKAEYALVKRQEAATKREAELDRIEDGHKEIQAHTIEIEKRVAQKQAQLDSTLDEIKNNRIAEVEAKKAAEVAQKDAEKARKELIVAQQERNELRQKQKDVDIKYANSVELFDGAKDLEQTNKVKEVALRNVEAKLNQEKAQLRQAQTQLVKEIETFRREKENGG